MDVGAFFLLFLGLLAICLLAILMITSLMSGQGVFGTGRELWRTFFGGGAELPPATPPLSDEMLPPVISPDEESLLSE